MGTEIKFTKDEIIAKQNAEIEYLKAEVELLKKLELQERQVKKGINVKIIWGSRCICVKYKSIYYPIIYPVYLIGSSSQYRNQLLNS